MKRGLGDRGGARMTAEMRDFSYANSRLDQCEKSS